MKTEFGDNDQGTLEADRFITSLIACQAVHTSRYVSVVNVPRELKSTHSGNLCNFPES